MRAASQKVSFSAAFQPGMPKTRMVTFQRATEKVRGVLALPRDPNRHRAIIVVHEWWGLNNWVKEQAASLAANGYVALAVDLYQGKVTKWDKRSMPLPISGAAVPTLRPIPLAAGAHLRGKDALGHALRLRRAHRG